MASTYSGLSTSGRLALALFVSAGGARAAMDVPASAVAVQPGSAQFEAPEPELDQLVYKDGDRVRGRFVERVGDTLVFRSTRFGLLHVPATDAELILAKPPAPVIAAEVKKDEKAEVEVERWPFAPVKIAQAMKAIFGSWHGRFSVGAEVLQDASDHDSMTVDAKLQRKWEDDEVQVNGRYDYTAVDDKAATDMVKGYASWRHDLSGKFFLNYRPSLEWNRAYYRSGVPSDYVLLQQEIGVGINLFNKPTGKLRVGVSENVFDTWVTPLDQHFAENIEAMFGEFEAKLPWRVTVTNRGVWYYSIADQTDGWENRFEITQKLTETVSIGVRHETRHNNPDVRSADYERLRLLFGLDF